MASCDYTYEITRKDDDGVRRIEIKRMGVVVSATKLPPRMYVEAARNVFDAYASGLGSEGAYASGLGSEGAYVEEHGIAAEVPTATD